MIEPRHRFRNLKQCKRKENHTQTQHSQVAKNQREREKKIKAHRRHRKNHAFKKAPKTPKANNKITF